MPGLLDGKILSEEGTYETFKTISSWWLASGFINEKLHHTVAGRSYSSEKTPKLTLIMDDIDTLWFGEFNS